MTLEITFAAAVAFVYTSTLLGIFSILDFKTRHVKNQILGLGILVGALLGIVTNHLIDMIILHVAAIIVSLLLAFGLFKLKSIGGADAKTMLFIAIVSPGIEFAAFNSLIYEAIIGNLIPTLSMLLLGYVYHRRKPTDDDRTVPLIPFLFLGYLIVQMFAFI